MSTIAISGLLGAGVARTASASVSRVEIVNGVAGTFGTVQQDDVCAAVIGPHEARLRIEAFSCNYRDRALLAMEVARERPGRVTPFGSEFCGVVEAIGPAVTSVGVGDRVMGNNALSAGPRRTRHPQGIPTSWASMEVLHLDARQLQRVPPSMSTVQAAAFSLAAQTAGAMVRRLALRPGEAVIVASARSVTSLFAIQLASAAGARVTAVSRSVTDDDERFWRALGAHDVQSVEAALAGRRTRASAAIDPFHDLNLPWLVSRLQGGGRVITCGFEAQGSRDADALAPRHAALATALQIAGQRSITIIGHCLGTTHDLRSALRAFRAGTVRVPVDAVYPRSQLGAFVARSFATQARRGKVVCTHA